MLNMVQVPGKSFSVFFALYLQNKMQVYPNTVEMCRWSYCQAEKWPLLWRTGEMWLQKHLCKIKDKLRCQTFPSDSKNAVDSFYNKAEHTFFYFVCFASFYFNVQMMTGPKELLSNSWLRNIVQYKQSILLLIVVWCGFLTVNKYASNDWINQS